MRRDILFRTRTRFRRVDAQSRPVCAPFGVVGRTGSTAELEGDLVVPGVGVAESSDELGKGGGGKRGAGHVDGGGGHAELWRAEVAVQKKRGEKDDMRVEMNAVPPTRSRLICM